MFPERQGPVRIGLQADRLGRAVVFALPNTSGRNAHYSFDDMLAAFTALREHLED
jgi:G:T/U-mismatch repair DNA glycosylase